MSAAQTASAAASAAASTAEPAAAQPAPKAYSSRLLGMKFMQRAQEKQTLQHNKAQHAKKEDEVRRGWAARSGAAYCLAHGARSARPPARPAARLTGVHAGPHVHGLTT
jgi:hypothetical protein